MVHLIGRIRKSKKQKMKVLVKKGLNFKAE